MLKTLHLINNNNKTILKNGIFKFLKKPKCVIKQVGKSISSRIDDGFKSVFRNVITSLDTLELKHKLPIGYRFSIENILLYAGIKKKKKLSLHIFARFGKQNANLTIFHCS